MTERDVLNVQEVVSSSAAVVDYSYDAEHWLYCLFTLKVLALPSVGH